MMDPSLLELQCYYLEYNFIQVFLQTLFKFYTIYYFIIINLLLYFMYLYYIPIFRHILTGSKCVNI